MLRLNLDIDATQMERDLKRLASRDLARAASRSLNRTIISIRQSAQLGVRKKVNLKARTVREKMTVVRSNPSTLESFIVVSNDPIPLSAYAPRERTVSSTQGRKKGVSVKIKGSRKVVRSAFVARFKSGKTGVFRRTSSDSSKRLPISELFSTNVADVFEDTGFATTLNTFGVIRFNQNFKREFDFLTSVL